MGRNIEDITGMYAYIHNRKHSVCSCELLSNTSHISFSPFGRSAVVGLTDLLGFCLLKMTSCIPFNSSLNDSVDGLLKKYLLREDRLDNVITFIIPGTLQEFKRIIPGTSEALQEFKCIVENGTETNEMVFQRQTNLSIRDFSNLVDRTGNTSNRVYDSDYLLIQEGLKVLNKTVCYYVVYSQADKRFKDIINVSPNKSLFSSSL